jgi:hypothetical protein
LRKKRQKKKEEEGERKEIGTNGTRKRRRE